MNKNAVKSKDESFSSDGVSVYQLDASRCQRGAWDYDKDGAHGKTLIICPMKGAGQAIGAVSARRARSNHQST
ncbi:hypothetical protein OS493_001329 [Desmophyllum pertusum]|uniref:Uncharacterized protein n=1 Tax=Desmophyllum pertusum TaxID=174260 RepID=A0A9X0D5D2_9CNID|nr:hypothetical protein OS493_001329 [Desmophyllum pertusum]